MAIFIELHERYSGDRIFVNVDSISSIEGHHHLGKDWQYTSVGKWEVRETDVEILSLLHMAQVGKYAVYVSPEVQEEMRKILPPKFW